MNDAHQELMQAMGTMGIGCYIHEGCVEGFLLSIKLSGNVIESKRTKSHRPIDVIGKYSDITHCDLCGSKFVKSDSKYFSYWVTTMDEIYRINSQKTERKKWWKFW